MCEDVAVQNYVEDIATVYGHQTRSKKDRVVQEYVEDAERIEGATP